MTIYRDGKAIELTTQELRQAYVEMRKEYTKEDIISCYDSEYDYRDFTNDELDCMYEKFEDYLDKNECYYDAYWNVIDMVIKEFLNN